ncbi:MAG: DUF3368 domain-containing protein [Bacteroidales bacterium]|nr:DUF3368 domain-containing protein [Bacteroidales bacterium]
MKIVIADTSALISLGIIQQIHLIEKIFGDLYITDAVWHELIKHDYLWMDKKMLRMLKKHVTSINTYNYLSVIMDYGESESVILYKELNADFLLVDDYKARTISESLDVNCIGSIGLLIKAKSEGYISSIKPLFQKWLANERYFSVSMLNEILMEIGETPIIR